MKAVAAGVAALGAAGSAVFHGQWPTVTGELARCRSAVEAAAVEFSTVDGAALMRPPHGRRRPGTLRTMRAAGYVPVAQGYEFVTVRELVGA